MQGQHVELAANYSGLVIALEHRYYGASTPTRKSGPVQRPALLTSQSLMPHFTSCSQHDG